MNTEQIKDFFNAFEKDKNGRFWRDVAETQLYLTARIQEVGGLLWKHVDFKRAEIEICDVAVYLGKKFVALKEGTKNGETRVIKMNKTLYDILQRRFKEKDSSCPFVFHLKGRPLDKDMIDRHYDKAFIASGLRQFSGTHFLRHTMANLLREHLSLDHAKAAGGWRSSRVVELIYTDTPTKLSTESLNCIENLLS
jgi:integrase